MCGGGGGLSVCLSTGFVPVGDLLQTSGTMACLFDRLTGKKPCKALAWRFGGRLPGMTMQSHGTVVLWHAHGDLLSDSQV